MPGQGLRITAGLTLDRSLGLGTSWGMPLKGTVKGLEAGKFLGPGGPAASIPW